MTPQTFLQAAQQGDVAALTALLPEKKGRLRQAWWRWRHRATLGTALMDAVHAGHYQAAILLLPWCRASQGQLGLVLNELAYRGDMEGVRHVAPHCSPSRIAVAMDHAAMQGRLDIVETLFSQVPPSSLETSTAIELAAQQGHKDVVNTLLERNIPGHRGRALKNAALQGYADVVELLLPHASHYPEEHAEVLHHAMQDLNGSLVRNHTHSIPEFALVNALWPSTESKAVWEEFLGMPKRPWAAIDKMSHRIPMDILRRLVDQATPDVEIPLAKAQVTTDALQGALQDIEVRLASTPPSARRRL